MEKNEMKNAFSWNFFSKFYINKFVFPCRNINPESEHFIFSFSHIQFIYTFSLTRFAVEMMKMISQRIIFLSLNKRFIKDLFILSSVNSFTKRKWKKVKHLMQLNWQRRTHPRESKKSEEETNLSWKEQST